MTDIVDYRAEFEAAMLARDAAGFLCTSPAETIEMQADEITRLRSERDRLRLAITQALCCTPSVRNGRIIYDCGDPWELLRTALSLEADVPATTEAHDNELGGGDQR